MIFGKAIGLHLLGVMQYGQVCGFWEFLELIRSKSMNKDFRKGYITGVIVMAIIQIITAVIRYVK